MINGLDKIYPEFYFIPWGGLGETPSYLWLSKLACLLSILHFSRYFSLPFVMPFILHISVSCDALESTSFWVLSGYYHTVKALTNSHRALELSYQTLNGRVGSQL